MKRYVYAASFDPAGAGEGIYGFRWLPHRRKLEPLGVVAAGVANPLCLVVSPCQGYLFVGDCTSDWRSGGYADRGQQAESLVKEILAIDREFSVAKYMESQPYKDRETLDRLTMSFREAGLPA